MKSVFVAPDGSVGYANSGGSHRSGKEGDPPLRGRRRYTIVDDDVSLTLKAWEAFYGPKVDPRHRHNYDQIRFILEGEVQYGIKSYKAGTLAYFPESVHYGPKSSARAGARVLTFQSPGPSGIPIFTLEDDHRGGQELLAKGVQFIDGIAHFPDGKKQDGFEAVWEQLAGHKIEYPPARYQEPIFMYTPNFAWQPSKRAGMSVKHLAYLNECGPNVSMLHLEPGTSTESGTLGCYQVRWVIEGEVEYAGQSCPATSFFYYPPDVPYEAMVSRSGATVLVIQGQPPEGEAPPMGVY
jgi:hypothetical protein